MKQHTGWDGFIEWMGILGSHPGPATNPAFYGIMYFYSYKINLTSFKLAKKNEEYFISNWKNEQTCCLCCQKQGSFVFYSSCMELKVDRGVTALFSGGRTVSLQDIQLKFLRVTLDRVEVRFIVCCAVE